MPMIKFQDYTFIHNHTVSKMDKRKFIHYDVHKQTLHFDVKYVSGFIHICFISLFLSSACLITGVYVIFYLILA
jgi:hypothetical protein